MSNDVQTCVMCGKPTQDGKQIVERIKGIAYVFDKSECTIMFKKLNRVYGSDFVSILTNSSTAEP